MNEPDLEDFLEHYGVKGMKWGVRRSRAQIDRDRAGTVVLTKKCKNGTELTVREKPQGRVMKYLSSKSSAIAEAEAAYHEFTFHDKSGKNVGRASFEQTSPTALGLEWIGINKKHRSNGYARAALEGVMEYAKDNGIEELNLTATDMGAPLYKSLGFKDLGNNEYQYKLPRSVKHAGEAPIDLLAEYIAASLDRYTEAELAKDLDFESGSKKGGGGTVTHNDADDFLAHYGVKGMKWGVRKKTPPSKKKTLGQKLNQSKFGEISRENSKRYNAKVKAAKSLSPEEQDRKQKIQKVVTIGEIAGTATVMAGAAYLQHLLRQGTN